MLYGLNTIADFILNRINSEKARDKPELIQVLQSE